MGSLRYSLHRVWCVGGRGERRKGRREKGGVNFLVKVGGNVRQAKWTSSERCVTPLLPVDGGDWGSVLCCVAPRFVAL